MDAIGQPPLGPDLNILCYGTGHEDGHIEGKYHHASGLPLRMTTLSYRMVARALAAADLP